MGVAEITVAGVAEFTIVCIARVARVAGLARVAVLIVVVPPLGKVFATPRGPRGLAKARGAGR